MYSTYTIMIFCTIVNPKSVTSHDPENSHPLALPRLSARLPKSTKLQRHALAR